MANSSDLDCRSSCEKSCITTSRSGSRSQSRYRRDDNSYRSRSWSPTYDTEYRSRSRYTRYSQRDSDCRTYRSQSRSPSSESRSRHYGSSRSVRHRDSYSYSDSRSRSRPEKSDGRSRSKSRSRSDRSPSMSMSKSPSDSGSSESQRKSKSGFDVLPDGVNLSPYPVNMAVYNCARRFHVSGLPESVDEKTLAAFFNQALNIVGANSYPGDAVRKAYLNNAKKFAFLDVRTVEEASNAMALDCIMFQGVHLRIKRPTDYNPAEAAILGPCQPNPTLNLSAVGLPLHKLFVSGFPCHFAEKRVKELLETVGPLQQLNVIRDYETGNLKGYAFCTYQNPQFAISACMNLNGLPIGKKTLVVKLADSNSMQSLSPSPNGLQFISPAFASPSGNEPVSRVLCLTGVVPIDELRDDHEYGELCQDLTDQCTKYGRIMSLVVPKPGSKTQVDDANIGNAFVEYEDTQTSTAAKIALARMKFAGSPVTAAYYPEDKYKILKGEMGIQTPNRYAT